MLARTTFRVCWFFLFCALAFAGMANAGVSGRGIVVTLKDSERPDAAVFESVQLYTLSNALVIGVDDYTEGWPKLSNAVKDAEQVAEELRSKGFDVTLKTDLNSRDLQDALEQFFVYQGADADSRLFVWFAGHGHTIGEEGYLVPADAPKPSNKTLFKYKALSMRRLGELVRQAESKHAMVVFDACFSGTVFDTGRSMPPPAVTRATTMPVRQYISSGDADQRVSDDGMFKELFLRALRGEEQADANRDGYLTGSELGLFLSDRVGNLTKNRQTPKYGKLRDYRWDRGDFVFVLPEHGGKPRDLSPPLDTAPLADREAIFWQSIAKSENPVSFEAYLAKYPNGTFTSLAKMKIEELRNEGTPAPNHQYAMVRPKGDYHEIKRDGPYVLYDNGIVYDEKTGLEWVAGPDKNVGWDDAKDWVEKLSLAGGGWRMPSRSELKSLYKEGKGSRNMTPLLKTSGWLVWSGETKGAVGSWGFYFQSGFEYQGNRYDGMYGHGRAYAVRARR